MFAVPTLVERRASPFAVLTLIRRAERNSLQVFYKRFSGHERAPVSDRQGADARRDAIPGQIVRFWGPGAQALDQ